VATAYVAAALGQARGAFNITADPVLGPDDLVGLMRSHRLAVPPALLRAAVDIGFRARAVPIEPGLLDLALAVPMMSSRRAREELGWSPSHDSHAAIQAFLDGLRNGDEAPTAPLSRATSGRFRSHEWATGVGARDR
jgi:nucleoside-diphosphate-sugar epimerase